MTPHDLVAQYTTHIRRRILFMLLIIAGIILAGIYAMVSGAAGISLNQVFPALTGRGTAVTEQIVWNIRMPRILAALLAGIALSASGAVMQSVLRNPLASPFTLGISNAAAFGAAFAIVVVGTGGGEGEMSFLSNQAGQYLVMISAFVWSMTSMGFILAIARYRGATPEVMILSGIVIGSLFGAGVSAMQYFASDMELAAIVFWMFGDLGRASWNDIAIISIVLVPVLLYFLLQTWNYKSLQAGDEFAQSLGVHASKIRLWGMLSASLATAVVVSFYGIIAFVGLVVPHIVRRFIGGDETFLIPASALFGGMFLLLSDTLARTVISPVILPVGILTSFIGAPLFLYLLIKGIGKGYWT